MISLFDELAGKVRQDPSLIRRSGPRQDLGLLLFAEREAINGLWKAAADFAAQPGPGESGGPGLGKLRDAVERLRPIFGERS
jgi:hypothetical protein